MPERRRRDLLTPLLAALAVILVLAFHVFRPFVLAFAVAACVALLLGPVQRRLAAPLLVSITTVVILIPVLTSLFLLARQATIFLEWVQTQPVVQPEDVRRLWVQLPERYPNLRSWILYAPAQATPVLAGGPPERAGGADGLLRRVLARVTHAAADLGLFLLMLFFLLRDGGRLRAELRPVSPFSEEQGRQMFDHLDRTIKGALQAGG